MVEDRRQFSDAVAPNRISGDNILVLEAGPLNAIGPHAKCTVSRDAAEAQSEGCVACAPEGDIALRTGTGPRRTANDHESMTT